MEILLKMALNTTTITPIVVITVVVFLISLRVRVTVFNAPFNHISVISWQSVLLVGETGENHQPG